MSTEAGIARRYARALFELIDEGAANLTTPLSQLAEVAAIDDVADLLASASIPAAVKQATLVKIVGDLPEELNRLLSILAERNKLSLLSTIGAQVIELMQANADAVDVELIAAFKLPAAARKKIAGALETVIGKKLNITTHQNKAIIGGFIVNIGDRRIDHSIRTRLGAMRTALANS